MNLILVVLASFLAAAQADCEACINDRCYSRKTLLQGLHGSPSMDIDRQNNVLYVLFNPNIIIAYYLEDAKIQLIQTPNVTGLAVNQNTKVLYTAGAECWHTFQLGSEVSEKTSFDERYAQADLMMFDNDNLIYTLKCCKGLESYQNQNYNKILNNDISDFVYSETNGLYFVANGVVHKNDIDNVFAGKKYVLSADKFGDFYFGDPEVNVIYKLDSKGELVKYAAYKSGKVGKLVFDEDNNILFHDSAEGTVNQWVPGNSKCKTEPPNTKYLIIDIPDSCDETQSEYQEQQPDYHEQQPEYQEQHTEYKGQPE